MLLLKASLYVMQHMKLNGNSMLICRMENEKRQKHNYGDFYVTNYFDNYIKEEHHFNL